MNTTHIVRGVTNEGKEVFYTGKSGYQFISENVQESFEYISKNNAQNRAVNLNRMTPIHGVWFIAIPK